MTNLFQTLQSTIINRMLFVVIIGATIFGCANDNGQNIYSSNDAVQTLPVHTIDTVTSREASFFSVYNQWQGVPYKLGGSNKRGVDCSAFVQIAYRDAWQLPLPRTTKMQSKVGENVDYENAKYGDLVFFKTSKSTKHVGVYLGNSRFMHASTSKGVIISRLDNPYWASTFWQFRRIDSQTN